MVRLHRIDSSGDYIAQKGRAHTCQLSMQFFSCYSLLRWLTFFLVNWFQIVLSCLWEGLLCFVDWFLFYSSLVSMLIFKLRSYYTTGKKSATLFFNFFQFSQIWLVYAVFWTFYPPKNTHKSKFVTVYKGVAKT